MQRNTNESLHISIKLSKRISNMPYTKNQSTKRFNFSVTRDPKSHKAGSNTLVISTNPEDSSKYSTGTTSVTMSVKEARVLQNFLNNQFPSPVVD